MLHQNIPTRLLNQALTTKSLLGQLILEEMKAFETKSMTTLTTSKDASQDSSYFVNPGTSGTLIPVSQKMQSYVDLLKLRKVPHTVDSYKYLFENVTNKILTLSGSYTFKEALVQIEKFRTKAGAHFYGAILRSTSKKDRIINPFHILTPLTYAKRPDTYPETEKFTVLLYFYANRKKVERSYNVDNNTPSDTEYVDKLLNLILMCANHKEEVHSPNIIEGFHSLNRTAVYNYRNRHIQSSGGEHTFKSLTFSTLSANTITEAEYKKLNYKLANQSVGSATLLLAAHQVMVNGIFAPDYGVSLLKKTSSTLSGTFLTPSVSCNIQSASNYKNLTWASVCTGRESQRTLQGISSLHCSNYASAYNSSSISNNSLLLADLSIEKSITLYQKLKLLPVELTSTPSAEELQALSIDFMTYLDYMTTTFSLDLIAIEARYNYIKTLGQTNETDKNKNTEEVVKETTTDSSKIRGTREPIRDVNGRRVAPEVITDDIADNSSFEL